MQKLRSDFKSPQPEQRTDDSRIYLSTRRLACGGGWSVSEVLCGAGPHDRPFEEQHSRTSIAIVAGGTFQYRTSAGRELMTPGSLMLGNAGDCFTCGHEHGTGDRCISFSYTPEFRERVAAAAGVARTRFKAGRLAPMRALSPLIAGACRLVAGADHARLEELSIQLLGQAIQIDSGTDPCWRDIEPSTLARVTRVVRMIDNDPEITHDLSGLAEIAHLSPYHFLRTFERVTGTTPHQYLLRMRLRRAAIRLAVERNRIVDIALDCGFGDISNFNRAFRTEFGVSPRRYRKRA